MILILGMPRSGTSYISSVIESYGYDFSIKDEDNLDNFYQLNEKYYQHKKLHIDISNTEASHFKNVNLKLKLPDVTIIKEPYLLFFLESNKNKFTKIILMIRNPAENVESIKNFVDLHYDNYGNYRNGNININYNIWNTYYINFLKTINKINIPYVIIDYNNMEFNSIYECEKLKKFLNLKMDKLNNKIFKNTFNCDLSGVPILSKYIYKNLISNDPNKYNEILSNYENISKIKPNDLCYCNSFKKFKKCCNLII